MPAFSGARRGGTCAAGAAHGVPGALEAREHLPRCAAATRQSADGRLHTSFNQTVAATGRLSSSDPNLQNIPIRRELGRDIRRGFIPRKGWLLLAADYSQIELRLLAHLSRRSGVRRSLSSRRRHPSADGGADLRRARRRGDERRCGPRKDDQLRDDLRPGPARPVAPARASSTPKRRSSSLATSSDFRACANYLDSMVAFAREHGYVQTIFGRRRYIPELRERNFNIRAFGERTAANSPIQGSAADLIKIAMIRIDDALKTPPAAEQNASAGSRRARLRSHCLKSSSRCRSW